MSNYLSSSQWWQGPRYIFIGPTPVDEDCAQFGRPDYYEKAKIECKAYVNQLRRQFGEPPDGARLTVKSFPYDGGSYHEVVVIYNNDAGLQYALMLEGESPAKWDDKALIELTKTGKFDHLLERL